MGGSPIQHFFVFCGIFVVLNVTSSCQLEGKECELRPVV